MTRDSALERFVTEFSRPKEGSIEYLLDSVGLFVCREYNENSRPTKRLNCKVNPDYMNSSSMFEELEKWYKAIGQVLGKEEL